MSFPEFGAIGRMKPAAVGLLVLCLAAILSGAAPAGASTAPAAPSDPWKASQIVRPAELAALLGDAKAPRPLLLHVGFKPLYRAGAIPGSIYAGPGSRSDGLAALRKAVKGVPRTRDIVLYCGCCPWDHCPNMRPAFKTLRDLGYTHVRPLYIAKNLDSDWVDHGYPIEKPKH